MNYSENIVELANVEEYEICILNIKSGETNFNKEHKQIPHYTGSYFRDEKTFFALYPAKFGPVMYYKGKEYAVKKELHITLKKMGNWREFRIEEYDIYIKYHTSKYIGFDVWSTEMDVDLFYYIEQSYKTDAFYEKYATYYEELITKYS